ncbi:hypothetical protein CVT25_006254 [Psilocybe cyanescens]|uniref:Uncharacterized protein n=1 Tax=Psilocybe cyanescens TaxID=93625 RepID=A0A409WYP4_PSICY|nr:hypothetical protein CVT25_006254 [Psilocybe cyanescens]
MAQEEEETDQHKRKSHNGHHQTQQPLFSKIRSLNHLALTSFGSLFSGTSSSKSASCQQTDDVEPDSLADSTGILKQDLGHSPKLSAVSGSTDRPFEDFENDLTPRVSDSHTPQTEDYWEHTGSRTSHHGKTTSAVHSDIAKSPRTAHISTFFPETRRFFGGLSRSRRVFDQDGCFDADSMLNAYPEQTMGTAPLASTAVFPSMISLDESLFSLPSESQFASHGHGHFGELETPPLTPDSLNNHVLPSTTLPFSALLEPSLASSRFSSQFALSDTSDEAPDDPEDGAIYTSPYLREIKEGKKPERVVDPDVNIGCEPDSCVLNTHEDPEEWYGLEYTLEMSSRERQPSESQSFSAGEHSKSRESWAAIHRGTIHPFFEDEDYRQWKNWHRFLDRQAEKKRHRKGYEFRSRSKDLAWFYEVFGVVARDVKERLQYIVERRPDPFFPPQKHDWSWYLKRSRSVACLLELKTRPSANA